MAVGRTNCVGGRSVAAVDLPTHPESISAASNNQKVIISLTYSDTDYISGVEVRYKTDGYPTSPTDGEGVTAEGAATSITIDGLANSTKYYFRVYLYREVGGVKYYQTDDTNATATGIPSAVGIDGITPAITADNYLLIDQSGTFTLTIPESLTVTAYLVSGGGIGLAGWDGCDEEDPSGGYQGGRGGHGGCTVTQQLAVTGVVSCSAIIGGASTNANTGTTTKFIVSGTTYTASGYGLSGGDDSGTWKWTDGQPGRDGLLTPYGYIGSSGGAGSAGDYSGKSGGKGGIGAGDGGSGDSYKNSPTWEERCGKNATNYGSGGGGGGGGYDSSGGGSPGYGRQGCIIIAWE